MRPSSPLRTVRDSFPSYGSSLPKGLPLWGSPLISRLPLINFAIQTGSHSAFRRKAHTLAKGRVHLLSSLGAVLPVFSQRDTRWTSAPFRAGRILNPYPSHYRMAFACSSISNPHLQQRALRFHLPEGTRQRYGVSTFRVNDPLSDLGVS